MKKLFFLFDQSALKIRLAMLFGVLIGLTLVWYFIFAQELWQEIKSQKVIQAHEQTVLGQLSQLSSRKVDFVFQNDLAKLQLRQVLDSLTSSAMDLSVTSFTDRASNVFPAGAATFPLASQELGIRLLPSLKQKNVKVKFSGGFYGFEDYLKAVQKSPYTIYFDRVDFKMAAYPKADITLDVFTLEGA